MKKVCVLLALASLFASTRVQAISLDDIQLWTGAGTNRAALVIEWNSPEVFNNSTVPTPIANKTMVWGFRFNGESSASQMFNAVVASDPQLYAVEIIDPTYGTGVYGIGYNRDGNGVAGITYGANTDGPNTFTNGILIDPNLNPDAAQAINSGDLFWSGYFGPNWQIWTELGDNGGFLNSPNRGASAYATYNASSYSYLHGQWSSAESGLDDLMLTNGSWIGFSVAAAGYDANSGDAAYDAYFNDEQAPPSPDGAYTVYVYNTNDFSVAIVSTNNIDPTSPYNNPLAVLGRPTLNFFDPNDGAVTDRVSIIDDPFNVTPGGSEVITEISNGGQITVKLGRKVYDDPNNPYGIDLIVYGNSFFSAPGDVSDLTDLDASTLSGPPNGHAAVVSVSQDGTNWYDYVATPILFPDNAYRWDDTNDSWTDEQMNPTKPLNPYISTNNFTGQTVASALDQFFGAAGGTGYALKASGFPWIQYVRVTPVTGTYTVIDAIAAVNPAVVGARLSIAPDNIAAGITNLAFQSPGNSSQNLISLNFDSVSELAKVSTVSLHEFSAFAPVVGHVVAAYQINVKPAATATAVSYLADLILHPAAGYDGNGSDLRVWQWVGTNWAAQAFAYSATNQEILVAGVTNFSAYVVSQIVPPTLAIQYLKLNQGPTFAFTPVPNCLHVLERSADLVTWTTVATITPASESPVSLPDNAAPAGKAFYRLVVTVP